MQYSLLWKLLLQAAEQKNPIYITLLDVNTEFDIVAHGILFDELYETGVDGDLWLIVRQSTANPQLL